MVLLKIFLPLATFFAVVAAFSSPHEYFYTYPLVPYSAIRELDKGYKICSDNSTTTIQRYEVLVKEARECYGELLNGNRSICHSFEINFQRCSQPLVDYFVDCLPEKSKDLPPTIVKGATAMVETFCTSSGEILLEAINSCIYEYQQNKTIKGECDIEKFMPRLDKFRDELPSKSDVCQFARELGDCWQDYLNEDCKFSKAKEYFSKFYNAALSACTK